MGNGGVVSAPHTINQATQRGNHILGVNLFESFSQRPHCRTVHVVTLGAALYIDSNENY